MSPIKSILKALRTEKSGLRQARLFQQGYETFKAVTWPQLQDAGAFGVLFTILPTWEPAEVTEDTISELYRTLTMHSSFRNAKSLDSYALLNFSEPT